MGWTVSSPNPYAEVWISVWWHMKMRALGDNSVYKQRKRYQNSSLLRGHRANCLVLWRPGKEPSPAPGSWTPSLQNVRSKFLGLKPPRLWCFVMAACARTPTTLRRSGLMRNITTTGEKTPETAVFHVKTLLPAHTAPLSAWCSLPKSYTWRLNMAKTITLDTLHLQILRAGRLRIWYQRAVGSTLPSGTIRPTHL